MPETIRVRKMRAAKIKMAKVNRAFSLMPRILSPATAQMVTKTRMQDHVVGQAEKGGGVQDGAHRRDTGGEDVVHHDGGHRHEGDQGAQDQVGKGVDPAADEAVVLQDLGDLHQPGGHVVDEDRGEGDEDDGAGADEAVGLGRGVKHRGELVHQGDDRHRQPGEPPAPVLVIGQPPRFPEQKMKNPTSPRLATMRRMLFRYNAVASQNRNRGLVHQAETGNALPVAAARILSFLRQGPQLFLRKITLGERFGEFPFNFKATAREGWAAGSRRGASLQGPRPAGYRPSPAAGAGGCWGRRKYLMSNSNWGNNRGRRIRLKTMTPTAIRSHQEDRGQPK